MKKASEFLNLWIAGPCQGGVTSEDVEDRDEFWNDSVVDEETETHWKSKHFVYESETLKSPVRIYVSSNKYLHDSQASMIRGEVTVEMVRNGFKTVISSDHPLELANNIASIIELDVDKDELPF
jgi:hypothetical protein